MYSSGNWCFSESRDNVYTLAAKGEYKLLGVANINETQRTVSLCFDGISEKNARVQLLDESHSLDEIFIFSPGESNEPVLLPYSFLSIIFE